MNGSDTRIVNRLHQSGTGRCFAIDKQAAERIDDDGAPVHPGDIGRGGRICNQAQRMKQRCRGALQSGNLKIPASEQMFLHGK